MITKQEGVETRIVKKRGRNFRDWLEVENTSGAGCYGCRSF